MTLPKSWRRYFSEDPGDQDYGRRNNAMVQPSDIQYYLRLRQVTAELNKHFTPFQEKLVEEEKIELSPRS